MITTRLARATDLSALIAVEAGATPNLSYLANVFDMFIGHKNGEFTVAEVDNKIVGCGKMTILPDGSAWLETIRVLPAYQGRGIGKRFYQRFLDIARDQQVRTLRMYTGTQNAVSRGLAEHFGFELAETFSGASLALPIDLNLEKDAPTFRPVTDPAAATQLLLARADGWGGYLVFNRTFFRWTPELCRSLVAAGQVYADAAGENIVVAGARFMPERALHIGYFSGDAAACMRFAARLASKTHSKRLLSLFPLRSTTVQQSLFDCGFQPEPAKLIVMERHR